MEGGYEKAKRKVQVTSKREMERVVEWDVEREREWEKRQWV